MVFSIEFHLLGSGYGLLALAITALISRKQTKWARRVSLCLYVVTMAYYVILTRLIISWVMPWPALLGYEVHGLYPVGVPYGDAIYVLAWYSLSVLVVLICKSIRWPRRA